MSTFIKTPAYGLEVPVGKMQTMFDNNLSWLGTNNIYGIIFRNQSPEGLIPEAWITDTEYKNIFNNDNTTSQIGFLPLDRNITTHNATVKIIVTVNLEVAYGATTRDNERAYLEVEYIIEKRHRIIEGSFKQGIAEVFAGFRTDNIEYLDMQPWDCFSFEVEMSYPTAIVCP